jgi:flagellar hook-length control protein FliK
VELNPPELGKVLIRFEQQEGSLTGLLEVDNRATADDIKQSLPQIIQNLRDSGIQVKRLDVMLNDQYQQPSRDSAFADMYQGRSGQQDQGRPWPYTDQAVYPNGSPDTAAVSSEPAQSQVSISTNGSINLLM